MDLRESLGRPVSDYASTDFVKVTIEDSVTEAACEMMKRGATEAVVTGGGGTVGIVTERDILYKVVAKGLDSAAAKVGAVMSAPVETIDADARVAEAIAKMSKLGVRRLGVTRRGTFVGLVTQRNMASGSLAASVPLPELAEKVGFRCPYCGESTRDGENLSKHIDRAHVGLGLLEGNLAKF
jgi:CBS domain-containing protein